MMIWLMAFALAADPTPEAEALGARLARGGTLAMIAPMLSEKDVAEVIAAHPTWTKEDIAAFHSTARRVAAADIARITKALGHAYASRLSVADLALLTAAAESPAATRRRAVEPAALLEALQSVGAIDFKGDALAAFCRETGKGCPAK